MRVLARFLLPTILFPVFATPASAQDWLRRSSTTAPAPATFPRMAYDSGRGRCVMFGGWNAPIGSIVFHDTWEWDGTNWQLRAPATVPTERDDHAMAYDQVRGRTVMFGGEDFLFALLGQTWTWNGTDWTDMQPAHAPSARLGTTTACDTARGVVVLFGGRDRSNRFADTWEWNGIDWTPRAPAHTPSPRSEQAFAWDAVRGRVVLFGGDAGVLRDDTWEYDGTDWLQVITDRAPPARATAGMVFDNARGRCVLFGGADALIDRDDTWEYDGRRWFRVFTANRPQGSSALASAYDSVRGRTVVFGGFDGAVAIGDTWEYGGNAAHYRTWGSGCAGSNGQEPQLVPVTMPSLGGNWTVELRLLPAASGFALVTTALSDTQWNGAPLPIDLTSFGLPGCLGHTSNDVVTLLATSNGTATWIFAIPARPALAGLVVYQQGVSFDPLVARPLPAAVSNAGEATLR